MLFLPILYGFLANSAAVFAKCTPASEPATFTWPLGKNIDQFEIKTQSWLGSVSGITYALGPLYLEYEAIGFNGADQAYVDTRLTENTIVADYGIIFNIFPEQNGVFFHYKSDEFDNPTGNFVQSIKLSWVNGSIETTYSNGSMETKAVSQLGLAYNSWYFLNLDRDLSKQDVVYKMYNDTATISSVPDLHDSWVKSIAPKFPGSLRIGGSLDSDSFFTGRVSCVQIVPCRNADKLYNSECNTTYWMQYTSTSTTTSSISAATTQITTTPTTSLTTLPTISSFLHPASFPLEPLELCHHYHVFQCDTAIDDSSTPLQSFMVVNDVLACSKMCSQHSDCGTFTFNGGLCKLATDSPNTKSESGTILYSLL